MKNSVPKSLNHYFYKSPSYNLDISNWDISKIKNMNYCFSGCRNLKSLDVSTWNTSRVEDISCCFNNCESF